MNRAEQHTTVETDEKLRPFLSRNALRRVGTTVITSVVLAGTLAGCVSAETHATPTPTTSSSKLPSPTPTEAQLPAPEKTETAPAPVKGLSGEFFQSTPSWEQDFSAMADGKISSKSWNTLVGPAPANNEAEYYSDSSDNLRIQNGQLILEAQNNKNGHEYSSARIDTQGKEDFLYGKFEISAKIPNGVGSWPAAWLLPTDYKYSKENPSLTQKSTYVDGEMDILEAIGSQQNKIYGIAHSLENPTNSKYADKYFNTIDIPNADTTFHTYGLEWTPDKLVFSVDDHVYYEVDKQAGYNFEQWPYDQKYHLIINLALGGAWAGQDKSFGAAGVDDSKLPSSLDIKSVKYFPFSSASN